MTDNLTILIPMGNEIENIEECLRHVLWAKNIYVVDSFSTDGSADIAKKYATKYDVHEYVNSATQKNWALKNIDTEWVLIVDSDERVTADLKNRILNVLKDPDADGYYIKRMSSFLGKPIKHCGWNKDFVLRLFRVEKGRYETKNVHADVILDGKVGRIKEHFLHYTCRDLNHYFEKFGRYTEWSSRDLLEKGKKSSFLRLFYKPIFRFLRQYVLQLGFLDGKHGLMLCMFSSFSVYTKYAKLEDLYRQKKINKLKG